MKRDPFAKVVQAFGARVYAPIFRRGENEFVLLYNCQSQKREGSGLVSETHVSFEKSAEEAFNLGQLSSEGTIPRVEGAEFTGKVLHLLDPSNAERRFGFCPLPSKQDQRATAILLSGPLWEMSAGAPTPESGEKPKMVDLKREAALILKGL